MAYGDLATALLAILALLTVRVRFLFWPLVWGFNLRQAWYAVLRHRRGNPDTRFAVTYTCRCSLSTLPVDGTLAGGTSPVAFELHLAKPS